LPIGIVWVTHRGARVHGRGYPVMARQVGLQCILGGCRGNGGDYRRDSIAGAVL